MPVTHKAVLHNVEEVETRDPKVGEVLIALEAAGVNPVDTYIASGSFGESFPVPYTPGIDGAGVEAALGPGFVKFKVGDRVYVTKSTTDTYATYCIAETAHTHSLPANVSFEGGACWGIPYFTAFRALFHKGRAPQQGDKVLVHGASGGVGIAAVQLAKQQDSYVVGTAGTPEGLAIVKGAGANAAVSHREPNYVKQLADLVPNTAFNSILEMMASKNLAHDLELAGEGGRILVIGTRGEAVIDPQEILTEELQVLGVRLFPTTVGEEEEAAASIAAMLTQGPTAPVISATYALDDAATAHVDVMKHHGKGATGKLVLLTK